MEREENRRR